MADYQFVTRWQIAAPIDQVWQAIAQSEAWPTWWPAVVSVTELEPDRPDGLGNVRRFVWKTPLSYQIAFITRVTQIQAPTLMAATASGDVEGHGLWQLYPIDRGTEVCYTWTVRTTRPWMNWLAAIARPLLEWNHNATMRQGGRGLAAYLQAELIQMDSVDRHSRGAAAHYPV